MNEVDLGEFMKFCKDFDIPLTRAKQQEIFKKCSISHKPHKIEQFTNAITRIGLEINNQKIEEVKQKLRIMKKERRNKNNYSEVRDENDNSRNNGSQMSQIQQRNQTANQDEASEYINNYREGSQFNYDGESQRNINEEGGNSPDRFNGGYHPSNNNLSYKNEEE